MSASAPPAGPSDTALVAAYAAGDQAAARALALRHGPRLHALARRMLTDPAEAEDVVQETLLRLWRTAAAWEDRDATLATWLYRVATNLCLDRLRRRRPTTRDAPDDRPDPAPAADRRLQAMDRAAALRAAIGDLPDRQRLAVVLRHFDERSNPEIAAILETSVEAVESLLARARRDLARRLMPQRAALGLDTP